MKHFIIGEEQGFIIGDLNRKHDKIPTMGKVQSGLVLPKK